MVRTRRSVIPSPTIVPLARKTRRATASTSGASTSAASSPDQRLGCSTSSLPSPNTPVNRSKARKSGKASKENGNEKKAKALCRREKEFAYICGWIEEAMAKSRPLSVYISGSPGTGKTATLRRVCEYFGRQTTFSFLNCASVTSQTKLIEGILNALECHARPTLSALTSALKGLRKHFVLILDEIDHLTSNTNTFLYAAFQWPQTITNKLIVIGVANSIDLTERLLPKLRLGQPPETLVFAPYTKDDITQIIKSKIANESEGCMDGAAVELCSRKVAAMTGDLRTALHVMKQTTDAHEPSTPRGCREVLGVLNGVFSSPLARARLPLQPRLLLAVAVVLSSNRKKALDVVSLTNAYHRACDVVKVPRLEGEDLDAALQILESQSFIARAPSGKLLLQVNAATAKLAIADNQMIAQVTGLNL